MKKNNIEAVKINTNVTEYSRNVAIDSGSYKPIAEGIEKLKALTSDIPWNDLYDALESGDLRSAMGRYWAEKNLMNWDNVDVRNDMRHRFSFLPGASSFPKRFITRQPNGEFNVSMEAIREENLKVYERTIEADQVEMVNQLMELMNKLKLNPYNFKAYIGIDSNGKAVPKWSNLAEVIGHR